MRIIRCGGRESTALVPMEKFINGTEPFMVVDIRQQHSSPEVASFATERVHTELGRFGDRIQRIKLRLRDVNGPRGGVDQACLMHVHLRGRGEVLVEECADDYHQAIAKAAERAREAVRRFAGRRKRGVGST